MFPNGATVRSRTTVQVETEKGLLRCKLDAAHDSVTEAGATCSGRIFFDDSGEKYLLCKNLSVQAVLRNSIDFSNDCSIVSVN